MHLSICKKIAEPKTMVISKTDLFSIPCVIFYATQTDPNVQVMFLLLVTKSPCIGDRFNFAEPKNLVFCSVCNPRNSPG